MQTTITTTDKTPSAHETSPHVRTSRTTRPSASSSPSPSSPPPISSPSPDVRPRTQQAHPTRFSKSSHVLLPLLLAPIPPSAAPPNSSPPASPALAHFPGNRSVAPRRQRVKERFFGVIRTRLLVRFRLRLALCIPPVIRNRRARLVLHSSGRVRPPRRQRSLVEPRVRRLEVKVRRRHAQLRLLRPLPVSPTPTASSARRAIRIRVHVRVSIRHAQVSQRALDSFKRGCGRVYGAVISCRRISVARSLSGRLLLACSCEGLR